MVFQFQFSYNFVLVLYTYTRAWVSLKVSEFGTLVCNTFRRRQQREDLVKIHLIDWTGHWGKTLGDFLMDYTPKFVKKSFRAWILGRLWVGLMEQCSGKTAQDYGRTAHVKWWTHRNLLLLVYFQVYLAFNKMIDGLRHFYLCTQRYKVRYQSGLSCQ